MSEPVMPEPPKGCKWLVEIQRGDEARIALVACGHELNVLYTRVDLRYPLTVAERISAGAQTLLNRRKAAEEISDRLGVPVALA